MAIEEVLRTKTGIQGLDKALNGGFPQGNIVLVSGGAGTGKSTFCLQFLVNGATLFGEKGLYVSTEQNRAELAKQAAGFDWKLADLEQRGLIKVVYFDITGPDGFSDQLNKLITEFKPKRLIIDSLTTLTDSLIVSGMGEDKAFSLVQIAETVNPIPRTEQIITKNILYSLFREIKKSGITTLLTTELPEDQRTLSADGVSEFIADGVLLLNAVPVGDTLNRSILVRKMRYTKIDAGMKSYDIIESGISIE
ncbi:Putative flagella-related protein H [uncultured archaeon]|nr:Putative flagella-related protein H [uncultured archaeon]